MCLYNKMFRNKKYLSNQKNGGVIPPVLDERVLHVPIGCGKCMECRKQKAREWQIRMMEDIKVNRNGIFVTLTFSNESVNELNNVDGMDKLNGFEKDNAIARIAVRRFLERWRKEFGKSVRHWLVTELGHEGTNNIHLHGIIWTNEDARMIPTIWKYGYAWIGQEMNGKIKNYVNERTVNYIVKYINKSDELYTEYNSIVLCSKGIGSNYCDTYDFVQRRFQKNGKTLETYRLPNGSKVPLPIYYRNKLYSDLEKELLWLQKLDKGVRYVCGQKVKADNDVDYVNLREYHRERNKQLGYGGYVTRWQDKEYQNARRDLLMSTRLKKAKEDAKKSRLHKGYKSNEE